MFKCQNSCISQLKLIKLYNIIKCVTHVDPENEYVDRINYDKFNQLITYLHDSIKNNKQVLKL